MKEKNTMFDYINTLIMLIVLIVMFYPVLYIVSISFSDTIYIMKGEITFYPKGFNIDAYKMIIKDIRIPRAYLNTLIYTSVGTFVNLFMTAVAAYPLSRRRLFGRGVIIKLIIFTMFFNGGIIPTYIIVQKAGLIDTMWALVIPNAIWTFYLLIMISFYESFETSIIESAVIDGASQYRILFQLAIPLSKPALASIGLFYFMGHWNSYFLPMIYLNDMKKFPLQLVLRDMLLEETVKEHNSTSEAMKKLTPYALKNATIFISMIPILLVYPFAQKYFVKGVMIGSVKG